MAISEWMTQGENALPAVPALVQAEVRQLSRLNWVRGGCAVAGDWLAIIACGAAVHWLPHPLTWLLAIVVIATRQHALAVLMHEAAHYRLLRNHAWNDRLSDWCLAYPLLFTTAGYRRHHLAHHAHLNTERDPDWVRKQGPDWTFPTTRTRLVLVLLRQLAGSGVFGLFKAMREFRQAAAQAPERPPVSQQMARLLYYLALALGITLTGLWLEFLILWLIPWSTLLPLLMRLRSIAEHSGLPNEHELNATRNVLPPLWERCCLLPHNVHYHLDHHLFPSVPFYHLPALHRLLNHVAEYADRAHQNDAVLGLGGGSVLFDLTRSA